jgi:hypothetical protein
MIQLYAILDCDHKKMNNLQLQQKDRKKEIAQLESFIKSDIDAREIKRAIAVRMAISGNTALPGVMRYNKNRLKKYTNESIFSRFAKKNSSSPYRAEAVDLKNSSDIFRQ